MMLSLWRQRVSCKNGRPFEPHFWPTIKPTNLNLAVGFCSVGYTELTRSRTYGTQSYIRVLLVI